MIKMDIDNDARIQSWADFLADADKYMLQCGTHKGARARKDATIIDLYDKEADQQVSVMNLGDDIGVFGSCCCHAMLEHVSHPAMALQEIARVVDQNGLVHIEVPWNQPMHYAEPWGDYHRWTLDGIRIDAEREGLKYIDGGWFGRPDYASVWMLGRVGV